MKPGPKPAAQEEAEASVAVEAEAEALAVAAVAAVAVVGVAATAVAVVVAAVSANTKTLQRVDEGPSCVSAAGSVSTYTKSTAGLWGMIPARYPISRSLTTASLPSSP